MEEEVGGDRGWGGKDVGESGGKWRVWVRWQKG